MNTDNQQDHWQNVYTTKAVDQVGWYTAHLQTSLDWISALKLKVDDGIIDVGGGASTLIDDLLALGYQDLTILDISAQAISIVKERLGKRADRVSWLAGDVTDIELPSMHYSLWHDRAVFHFLVEQEQQQNYIRQLLRSLKPGGYLIMGVFDLPAPPQCSGLPVQLYSVEILDATLGDKFKLRRQHKEVHHTPSGLAQAYIYCQFERLA